MKTFEQLFIEDQDTDKVTSHKLTRANGNKTIHTLDNKQRLHSIDRLPAYIEYKNGKVIEAIWCKHGEYHRENGPAVIRKDGTKEWWLNDLRCRYDGPALIPGSNKNYCEWWINSIQLGPEDYRKLTFDVLVKDPNHYSKEEMDRLYAYGLSYDPELTKVIKKALSTTQEDLDALSI